MISIFVDNNMWDYLHDNKIHLRDFLSKSDFKFSITREGEIELNYLLDKALKENLEKYSFLINEKSYIELETDFIFGFDEANVSKDKPRYGGFGVGARFQSKEESDFYGSKDGNGREIRDKIGSNKRPNTDLRKNEADASLASRSFSSIVLTNEKKNKSGPLRDAAARGGMILFREDFQSPDDFKNNIAQKIVQKFNSTPSTPSGTPEVPPAHDALKPEAP